MRGLTLMELAGLYALALGLFGIIGAAFLVGVALGLLAVGVIGVTLGLSLLVLAAYREQAAKANGQHAGGSGQLRAAA